MKPNTFLLCTILLLFALALNAQNIDANKAYVGFEISILACQKIKGNFSAVHGTFILDCENLQNSIINFDVDVASIRTHKNKYYDNLFDDGFFYPKKYPKIYFKADSVVHEKSGYKALGSLTLNGESKNIEVKLNLGENRVQGVTNISRHDFNIGTRTYPRSFPVHESVKLKINYSMD